jgi:SagB-type dehydrogenase family enzyme
VKRGRNVRTAIIAAALALGLAVGCAGKPAEEEETATPCPVPNEDARGNPGAAGADYKELPPPAREGGAPLYEVIASRRSTRTYGDRKLTDAEVSRLLWAGQGITSKGYLRAAPSAGALYPITLYYADDVALWRYEPDGPALARVTPGDVRPEIAAAGLGQAPLKRAPGIIIIIAKPSVTAVKYGDRAERYCILEAGHVCQNILLAAEDLGLGACPVGAFRDAEVLDVLGLGDDYAALYLIPVGERFEP